MSGRRDGSYVRSQRLLDISRQIAKIINTSPTRSCSAEEVLCWVQFDLGLTEKTAKSYVDLVVKAKGWIWKDGFIKTQI